MAHPTGQLGLQSQQLASPGTSDDKGVPRICKFYNNETGCKHGEKCNSLHVCLHYLKGCCKFGKTCKRSHNIYEPKAKSILVKFGIDVARSPKEVLKELIPVYSKLDDDTSSMASSGDRGSVSDSSHPSASARAGSFSRPRTAATSTSRTASESSDISLPSGAASPSAVTSKLDIADSIEGGEICSYSMVGSCRFGDKCWKVHSDVPFQWQHQLQNTGHWQNFPGDVNIDIEEFYCLPEKDSFMYLFGGTSHKLNFDELTLISPARKRFLVRRLSTASSVKADENYTLPTKWLWYWEDEEGTWRKYGSPGPRVTSADVCMETIEKKFQENPMGEINFTTNDENYTLNFESMSQKNTRHSTRRKVRCRPQLQTKSDVQAACVARKQKKAVLSQAATGQTIGGITIPKHWQLAAVKGCEYYKKVKIESSGSTKMEYEEIAQLFSNTMHGYRITAIHRIENLELWENYCRKRSHMQRKLSPGQVFKEERLFHGTRQQYMDAICERDGFDWRLSGSSTGTLFGKGSYFARDASYSRCYTDGMQMFVVKVSVGDFAKGAKDMVRPPPKDPLNPTGALYDSCVDDVVSPRIYVIFDHSQAYPEYIIEYT